MRGTITFDHHGQHAWLHFAIRLAFVLLLILLILFAAEKVVGQTQKVALTHAKARLGKSNTSNYRIRRQPPRRNA
jgi:hypothetical protein